MQASFSLKVCAPLLVFHANKLFLLSFIKSFTCGESLNFGPFSLTVLTGTAFEVA